MLKKIIGHRGILLALTAFTASPGLAFEKVDGARFQAACQAYQQQEKQVDEELCVAYLLGYLSAAQRFYLDIDSEKTYHDRARETRAKGLLYKDKRMKGKRYCIPGDESLDDIISRINEVAVQQGKDVFAENVVESALDMHYRCPG